MARKYGWDYYQYKAQPIWFIDILELMSEYDAKFEEFKSQESKNK